MHQRSRTEQLEPIFRRLPVINTTFDPLPFLNNRPFDGNLPEKKNFARPIALVSRLTYRIVIENYSHPRPELEMDMRPSDKDPGEVAQWIIQFGRAVYRTGMPSILVPGQFHPQACHPPTSADKRDRTAAVIGADVFFGSLACSHRDVRPTSVRPLAVVWCWGSWAVCCNQESRVVG